MHLFSRLPVFALACFAALIATGCAGQPSSDSTSLRAMFANPPRQYSTAPLWVWNDDLTEEQVVSTLRDLAGQQVKQVFVHPRPSLITPYLSERWMQLWKLALEEGKRRDMNVWIYDENSYPSGFAGGWVCEKMPESRGRGLVLREVQAVPKWTDETLAVYRLGDNSYEDFSAAAKTNQPLPPARYVVAQVQLAKPAPWHGGRWYVDLLHPGVTQTFLEVTLEAYRRAFGEEFGKHVPGSFTDEPQIHPAGGLPWTPDLPEQFQKRWGYSLMANLPALSQPVGTQWKQVRHDYYQLLNDLFVERWAKPYSQYCAQHNLEFTGHYWEHDWPQCLRVPDNMAMYAWHQRPSIDTLMNNYSEDVHAQFGNVRSVKELASVANQMGRSRTLCELYGAGGWDLRFEDMKRIADWLGVLGVNTMDEHLSYISIRGARKHDHPQSFSYHEPWWNDYHVMAAYSTRLCAAISSGQEINRILVLEPTTTAWLYNTEGGDDPHMNDLGKTFQQLITDLARQQVEFDIGSEDLMSRHGSVQGNALVIGKRSYTTVVIPPLTENFNGKTVELLDRYLKNQGLVLACGATPTLVEGRWSEQVAALAQTKNWQQIGIASLAEKLLGIQGDACVVKQAGGDKGILFHQRRQFNDGQMLFLVNSNITDSAKGTITAAAGSIERWNLATGRISAYPFKTAGNRVEAGFDLPPCGSLMLFLRKGIDTSHRMLPLEYKCEAVPAKGVISVRRVEPNVLTLDYVDVTAGGETHKDMNVLAAANFVFRKHGFERNPWDRAVQYKDELIRKTFPAGSGFEATYRFTIEGRVPESLFVVIERADLYTVTCNGKPVSAAPGAWWLDKAFGKIDIASAAKSGENSVVIKASPMTMMHELDNAYVLGDFGLKAAPRGFVIVPKEQLKLGAWNEQGMPLYAAGVAYRQSFEIVKPAGRYVVRAPKWYGSIARIMVNDKLAGRIWRQPWECDITDEISPGYNKIDLVVIGTLKNTLGPHHRKPPLGSAWPGMWDNAPEHLPPGAEYATVGYGLFEPFRLDQELPYFGKDAFTASPAAASANSRRK